MTHYAKLAQTAVERCRTLAEFTEVAGTITRTFLSAPMRDCNRTVAEWMQALGMYVGVDAIGNVRGLLGTGNNPRLLLGSHLDTVPDAGAYDGVLGVCIALAITAAFNDKTLPFDIEVLGFSEEEGVRFDTPFLGSLALCGRFDEGLLERKDIAGKTMRQTILEFGLDPSRIGAARFHERSFAYLEFHIEQGPVLDSANESIASVETIAGQSRLQLVFTGRANHAGTTPMDLRRDALCGAAEWISAVEQYAKSVSGLVATVGSLEVVPGASNVVVGGARATLDVRHSCDETRIAAVHHLRETARQIASSRRLGLELEQRLNQRAVPMNHDLRQRIDKAIQSTGQLPRRLVSGAGHDAMIMAEHLPTGMIFLRSPNGISHHPEESVRVSDVELAIRAGVHLAEELAQLT